MMMVHFESKNGSKSSSSSNEDSHSYRQRNLGCPCPGISILINHGYLNPKDSLDPIKPSDLVEGLIECFNLSRSNAILLSIAAARICGFKRTVSISQLGGHGLIEHDASITRFNHSEGDSLNPSPELINKFLGGLSNPDEATLMDYAIRLQKLRTLSIEANTSKTKFLGGGEVGLTISIFGDGSNKVNSNALRSIFLEERLPDDYKRPIKPVSFLNVSRISFRVNKLIKQLDRLNKTKTSNEDLIENHQFIKSTNIRNSNVSRKDQKVKRFEEKRDRDSSDLKSKIKTHIDNHEETQINLLSSCSSAT